MDSKSYKLVFLLIRPETCFGLTLRRDRVQVHRPIEDTAYSN